MQNVTDIELATVDSSKVIDANHCNCQLETGTYFILPIILNNRSRLML